MVASHEQAMGLDGLGLDGFSLSWLKWVHLSLRLELGWRERLSRALSQGGELAEVGILPDRAAYRDEVRAWLGADGLALPEAGAEAERGSLAWLAFSLRLHEVELFALALALADRLDPAVGTALAQLDEQATALPSIRQLQRLLDEPALVLERLDCKNRLFSLGLLQAERGTEEGEGGFRMPTLIGRCLLLAGRRQGRLERKRAGKAEEKGKKRTGLREKLGEAGLALSLRGAYPLETLKALPRSRRAERGGAAGGPERVEREAAALRLGWSEGLRLLPLLGEADAEALEEAHAIASIAGLRLARYTGETRGLEEGSQREALFSLCWMRGQALYLDAAESARLLACDWSLNEQLPLVLFACVTEANLRVLSERFGGSILPEYRLPGSAQEERLGVLQRALAGRLAAGVAGDEPGLLALLPELARRYRYELGLLRRIAQGLANSSLPLRARRMDAAFREAFRPQFGESACLVQPRFARADLILPPAQSRQFDEIAGAMRALTSVHYEWGTARAWNECGISALFSGAPGTGKTMAAEVLAEELGLPLYRVDLAALVSKYIGETEKNLSRLFDAAERADILLFFDEADAIFGKRTEVQDAHDRFANIEVSYLLQRMERAKGLVILATNRKDDLDPAFLRRLRFVLEFPLPGEAERLRLWQMMLPSKGCGGLDLPFLARQFPLSGGNLRGIVFNAMLLAAGGSADGEPRLEMRQIVPAIQQEFDKLGRRLSANQFGPYAAFANEGEARRG